MTTKEKPGDVVANTGHGEKQMGKSDFIPQSITLRFKRQVIKILLPYAATILTSLPYNNWASRFLDRLVWISEAT